MAVTPSLRAFPFVPFGQGRRVAILDGYIVRELVAPFGFALAAFLLFQLINIFFVAADYIITQHAPFFLVLRFILLRLPLFAPLALPFACLFAVLLAFGRLAADNEITALRTSGISFTRIAVAPAAFGLAAFLLAFTINDKIVPWSTDLSTRAFYQIVYKTASLPIEPQLFRKDPDTQRVFYVGSVAPDNRTMQGIMIFQPSKNSYFQEVITAKVGVIVGASLILDDAIRTRYKPDGLLDYQLKAQKITIGLPIGETASAFLSSNYNDPFAMDAKKLKNQIDVMRATGQGGPTLGHYEVILAQKLSFPFACVIAVLLGLPLSVRFGRQGRTIGIALSIVTLFVYYLLFSAFATFGRDGELNPYLAAWLPNILMGGLGGFLLYKVER